MRCPMCRAEIDDGANAEGVCGSCPLYGWSDGCLVQLVACPRCGYHSLPQEYASESREPPDLESLSELELRPPEAIEGAQPLTSLRSGARARVVGFDGLRSKNLQRLVAHGLVPGVRVEVLQRLPAYVLKIYETELAIESAVARTIAVVPDGRGGRERDVR